MIKKEPLQDALDAIRAGENVFITGQAGTGKSFLLNQLRREFRHMVVTASTGAAAVNVGGTTVHSFAGMGICNKPAETVVMFMNEMRQTLINSTELLAIDEISMISARTLDYFNRVLQLVRGNEEPFGGIQVICIGDFLQLPPVQQRGKPEEGFAFESEAWEMAEFHPIILEKIYRQDDPKFMEVLGRARIGAMLPDDVETITMTDFSIQPENEAVIQLFAKNQPAIQYNQAKLNQLKGSPVQFLASDTGKEHHIKTLDKNCLAPKELYLKPGARVMLVINYDFKRGLINGSMGIVQEINKPMQLVTILFDNDELLTIGRCVCGQMEEKGRLLAEREQIPLRLAWAISIHKSQGMTLSNVHVDMMGVFEFGQAYVALSRAKDLKGLKVMNLFIEDVKAHPKAVEFMEKIINDQR